MVVLMRVKVKGQRARSCNARCYNAKRPDCSCICAGGNHGAGFDKAVDNTVDASNEFRKSVGDGLIIFPDGYPLRAADVV